MSCLISVSGVFVLWSVFFKSLSLRDKNRLEKLGAKGVFKRIPKTQR